MSDLLHHRIRHLAYGRAECSVTIPELVVAFPEVDEEPLAEALLKLANQGEITRQGAVISVRPLKDLRELVRSRSAALRHPVN